MSTVAMVVGAFVIVMAVIAFVMWGMSQVLDSLADDDDTDDEEHG